MDASVRESKEDQVTNYKFKIQNIGGIPYRFPQINLNRRPFDDNVQEDLTRHRISGINSLLDAYKAKKKNIQQYCRVFDGYIKRAEEYKTQAQLKILEENEEKKENWIFRMFIKEKQQTAEYSHFLSIPVGYDDTIKENYSKIIGEISKLTGITKDKFTRPSMLHLNVLMLPLQKDLEKIMKVK